MAGEELGADREALASLLQSFRYSRRLFPASAASDYRDADSILAAGFRRSKGQAELTDAHTSIRLLKESGVGAYSVLLAVTNVYELDMKGS